MSIGLLLLITIILTVSLYVLFVYIPQMKKDELARRREYRADVRAREDYYQRELTKLYIDTLILR